MHQFRFFDFTGAIDARAQFLDPFLVEIEADHRRAGSRKCDCHGQADIAESDHGNLASMRHHTVFNPASPSWSGCVYPRISPTTLTGIALNPA